MKTRNIRYATLLLAVALSLNVSAQKNVLKAFEKLKESKGVTIVNSMREQGWENESAALAWRYNMVEFKLSKVYGASLQMRELQAAFERDRQDPDVTYFGEMRGLPENASEEDKAKYKKTVVRYNVKDDPIVLGANTTYNVLVLRSKSQRANHRIVVATEWKQDGQGNVTGSLYEIEGPKDYVRATTERGDMAVPYMVADTLRADTLVEDLKADYIHADFITRMTFYRDHYTGEPNGMNDALLVDMFNFVRVRVDGLITDNERAVGCAIVEEMEQRDAPSPTHRSLIANCKKALAIQSEVVDEQLIADRINSYYQEWRNESTYAQQDKILNRMSEYICSQADKGMSDTAFNTVVRGLGTWKSRCTVYAQKDFIADLLLTIERKQNGAQ